MIRNIGRWSRAGAICAVLLGMPGLASAAEPGFYIGAYYGQGSSALDIGVFDEDTQEFYDEYLFVRTEFDSGLDTKDAVYGFFGGYRFTDHWALEGGFVDMGEFVYHEQSTGNFAYDPPGTPPRTFRYKVAAESRGMQISALAILPVGYRFELYGRASFAYLSSKLRRWIDDDQLFNVSQSDTTYMLGAGAAYRFADIYALRLEYQRAFDVNYAELDQADLDTISLGFTVTF
ncbi:opacity protein-like surface antigen [Povalibacter uvarum]|uniref:Opacity protein-like surface antigen n=1 Tax=Povalibacter uvarum TaxID=732238 RepID=A0A841HJS3_9GAMM|nr:outer membrane beta-barrel protein [Povalibacter uvarum]MBB6093297.1 opacity protein-like surface antigen [Povalibacter uvarum]